jgi:hypothetical protein
MDIDDLVKGITEEKYINMFAIIGILLSPVIVAVFYFDLELFKELDSIKLLLLALSFVIPLVFINYFFLKPIILIKKEMSWRIRHVIVETFLLITTCLAVSYLAKSSFSLFVLYLIAGEAVILSSSILWSFLLFNEYMQKNSKKITFMKKLKIFIKSLLSLYFSSEKREIN